MTDKELITKSVRNSRILIVDDDCEMTVLLEHHLKSVGFKDITICENGEDALVALRRADEDHNPYALMTLDLCFPGEVSGQDVYKFATQNYDISVVVISALSARDEIREALKSGIVDEYMIKPIDFEILQLVMERSLGNRLFIKHLKDTRRRTQKMFLNILQVMAKVLEAKDSNTRSHSENVAKYARQIAKRIGYSELEMEAIQIAGILHDFGKIGVDEALLRKPGTLTDKEYENIKQHPLIASIILEPLEELRSVIKDIRHHHEKYDGSGYPDKLSGSDIPLGARILSIADAYDAMTSKRSYHQPVTPEVAISEIKRCTGTQFDPELTLIFEEVILGPQHGISINIPDSKKENQPQA